MGSVEIFGLATRGVNVVEAPTHLSVEEVTSAQNAEVVSDAGENALDQRPGMSKVNASPLSGSVVMVQDVPSEVLLTKTPTLYASMHPSTAHNWRKTTDGTTWTNDDTPAHTGYASAVGPYYKIYAKAVTIKGKLYYTDGSTPIKVQQFDGITNKTVSTVPPAVSGTNLGTPNSPGGSFVGYNSGATTYSYKIVAIAGGSHSAASAAGVWTVSGPATLNATTDFNAFSTLGAPLAGATSYDIYRTAGGATQGKIGTVPIVAGAFTTGNGSGLSGATLTPNIVGASASYVGSTPGATTYSYVIVLTNGTSHSVKSGLITATNGDVFARFNSSNGILVSQNSTVQTGATSADIYRTVGGTTQGKIGTLTVTAGVLGAFYDTGLVGDGTTAPTTGLGFGNSPSTPWIFSDGGLVGDASVAPVAASGVTAGDAVAVLDAITDGTSMYLAVLDLSGLDPNNPGRILKYTPGSNAWAQLGAAFPTASGNGNPGVLTFYGGALSYATFGGATAGNTTYVNNVGLPLPAGGVQEVHTTAASQLATSMAVFNGDLYVGYTHLGATAATLVKRVPNATWSTSLTAPGSTAENGWTSMCVFNGKLFAGWNPAGAAGRVYSTSDGVTWTSELTTGVSASIPAQMVVFKNKLYVSFIGFAADALMYQRDTAGTWTLADDTADNHSGALAVVYV